MLKMCYKKPSFRRIKYNWVEAQLMVDNSVKLSNKIDAFSKKMDTVVTSLSETNKKHLNLSKFCCQRDDKIMEKEISFNEFIQASK